jgi:hypothetical protein
MIQLSRPHDLKHHDLKHHDLKVHRITRVARVKKLHQAPLLARHSEARLLLREGASEKIRSKKVRPETGIL